MVAADNLAPEAGLVYACDNEVHFVDFSVSPSESTVNPIVADGRVVSDDFAQPLRVFELPDAGG